MLKNSLIDGIIKEPLGGAHTFPDEMYKTVKEEVLKNIKSLSKQSAEKRIENRIEKFCAMGVIVES